MTKESQAVEAFTEKQKTLGFRLKAWLLPPLVHIVYRLLSCTWKLDEGPMPPAIRDQLQKSLPVICAHWHEDEWALLKFYVNRQMIVMVSRSEDGSLMSRFLERCGFQVTRGSSSRGAAAGLLQLIRVTRSSSSKMVSLAVDGPRGPRHRAKKGVFKLSQSFDADILPGCAVADRAWVFRRSWSKAFIPKPFARVVLRYGEGIDAAHVKKALERDDYAQLCYELEERLKSAKSMARESMNALAKNH